MPYGVAYHHSGLTSEEREVVEKGFREGTLLVLCATSTLSTGINLPAKAVIFKGPFIGRDMMDAAKYKQMSGRAGRTGFDAKGDSIMVCNHDQIPHVQSLIKPFKCQLKSALTGCRLMRSLLEIIASGSISSLFDLDFFIKNTLKYTLCNNETCANCFKNFEFNEELFSEKAQKRVYD